MAKKYISPPVTAMGKRRMAMLRYISLSPSGCRKTEGISKAIKAENETTLRHLHWLQEKGLVRRIDRLTWSLTFVLTGNFDAKILDEGKSHGQ